MVAVMVVDGVGGVLVAVVFVGGVYVLCWLLCCVVVNPHKSHSYFRFSGLPVRPQFSVFYATVRPRITCLLESDWLN